MSEPINVNVKELSDKSRLGRMLTAGRLTATLKSKVSGEHITISFASKKKNDSHGWENASFEEVTHVFINHGQYQKVGTYYPKNGRLYMDKRFDTPAYQYTVKEILKAAASGVTSDERHEIKEAEQCGRCGRQLTDPISIERGIGPECYGKLTGSQHYQKETVPNEKPQVVQESMRWAPTEEEYLAARAANVAPTTDRKGRTVPKTFADLAAVVKK